MEGSTVTIRDRRFLTLASTRPSDPKAWKGRVELKLRRKQQLRHGKMSELRRWISQMGKPEPKTALRAPSYLWANKEEPVG